MTICQKTGINRYKPDFFIFQQSGKKTGIFDDLPKNMYSTNRYNLRKKQKTGIILAASKKKSGKKKIYARPQRLLWFRFSCGSRKFARRDLKFEREEI